MRDYNVIQFKSPSKKNNSTSTTTTAPLSPIVSNHHPPAVTERVGSTSSTTAASSSTINSPPRQQSLLDNEPHSPPITYRSQSPVASVVSASPNNNNNSSSSSSSHNHNNQTTTNTNNRAAPLSAADALAVRRDGAETVICRLREQLEAADRSALSSKSAVAKSDAVILELRSTVRQLRRQLEKVQQQQQQQQAAATSAQQPREDGSAAAANAGAAAAAAATNISNRDAEIGELQVQLDRAHAQILTADMVRKELEDTLEAEQYTWELRVQDQERELAELTQHVAVLQHDLDTVSSQWKEAETGWAANLQHLKEELAAAQQEAANWKAMSSSSSSGPDRDATEWKEKLLALEQERQELQGCLDEALKELEAVDAELQNDGTAALREENERLQQMLREYQQQQQQQRSGEQQQQQQQRGINISTNDTPSTLLEPLQHLYRWLLERDGSGDDNNIHLLNQHETAADLIDAIQAHLESNSSTNNNSASTAKLVQELEQQLSVYRGDLKAREESSAELRASLKEAVALLKPLQDAVAKADREKAKLQEQLERAKMGQDASLQEIRSLKQLLNAKDDELDQLKQEIESLELQLSKAKLVTANNVVSHHQSNNRSMESWSSPDDVHAREELRAKRQSEKTLKQLLRDAQTRFNSLQQQNQQVAAMNNELQGRLREAGDSTEQQPAAAGEDQRLLQETIQEQEAKIQELENEVSVLRGELARRDVELRNVESQLHSARLAVQEMTNSSDDDRDKLSQAEARVRELENELSDKSKALAAKRDAERALSKSLKDALGLIKPLQMHLEEAEMEKREIAQELMDLKRGTSANGSRSVSGIPSNCDNGDNTKMIHELESTVQQLEKENSQLQDALEDMSQSLNASHLNGANLSMVQQQQVNNKNEARLREEFVELKSRYEVTLGRLEDAFVENHTLVEALQKREKEENDLIHEVKALRERLKNSEAELDNAKFIATSALVKVEELSMAEDVSLNSLDHEEIYKQKERELDHEMRLARQHRSKVPYRLA